MSKIELNISDKKLYNTTKEDIVLNSPSKIPPKGIHDLISLKGINSLDVAYYDIAPTEQQYLTPDNPPDPFFYEGYDNLDMKMGDII